MGAPELSPDGKWLAVVAGEYQKTSAVLVYPVAGGDSRELFRVNQPEALRAYGGIAWTPDSQHLVIVNDTLNTGTGRFFAKDLWLLSLNGDKPRKLEIDVKDWSGAIRLSADGKRIAFFSGHDAREVWALEGVTATHGGKPVGRQ